MKTKKLLDCVLKGVYAVRSNKVFNMLFAAIESGTLRVKAAVIITCIIIVTFAPKPVVATH